MRVSFELSEREHRSELSHVDEREHARSRMQLTRTRSQLPDFLGRENSWNASERSKLAQNSVNFRRKGLVSIIIVNYNGGNLLRTILDSINKSNVKNYEILIVDNNSSDGSQEFLKKNYKNIKLVLNKRNLGYSGINSALKYCKGEFILF